MHDAQASKLPAYAKSASWNQVGPSPDKNNLSSILWIWNTIFGLGAQPTQVAMLQYQAEAVE